MFFNLESEFQFWIYDLVVVKFEKVDCIVFLAKILDFYTYILTKLID